jgi:hypothetical protein
MAGEQQIEGEEEQELEGQEGEGEQGGKKGPNGWIPKVRFDEVIGKVHGLEATLQQERDARIRLEEQVKAGKTEPQRHTKQQLREAVATGQLTQDQADDIWDAQREAEITEKVMGTVQQTNAVQQTATKVNADLSRYKALAPDLMVEGSETRTAVAERYDYLLSIGAPPGSATQLAAANAVLGPIDRLEQARKGRAVHQTHEETGGGGKGKDNDGGKGKSLLDQAPARYRQHYENLISKGVLTKDQAEKEIKRAGLDKLRDREKRYG